MKTKDLKNSILQMAVEGKLVPQDPSDEPASVLLERIREEKHELIAEGKVKFPKGGESIIYIASDGSPYEKRVDAKGRVLSDKCIADEVPFEELPEGWCWTRLGNLLSLVSDGTHKTPQYTESGVLFLSVQNVSGGSFDLTRARYISRETHEGLCRRVKPGRGDILLCRIGTLGKPIIVDVDYEFSIFVSLGLLRPISIAIAKWICSCIDSPVGFAWIEKVKVGGGTHTFKINLGDIPDFILPLPPLAEQRRIVERVGELMPLVEEYGKLEDVREGLDAALPGRLRKSVLQMAVQGKLVPQDPADEPASVLLERIREHRRQLVAEKKMRAPKGDESVIFRGSDGRRYEKRVDARGRESGPACIEDEIPFKIPDGWEWVRLEGIGDWKAGATPAKSKPEYYANGTIPWLLTGDLNDGIINEIPNNITEQALEECSVRLNPAGSVLIAMYGATIGRIGVLGVPATTNQACCACILYDDAIREWLTTWLLSYKPHFVKLGMGGAQPNISRGVIVSRILPLPPLAEQRRIVERVRKILSVIG